MKSDIIYKRLKYLKRNREEIPPDPGVYLWIYHPEIEETDQISTIMEKLERYSRTAWTEESIARNNRYQIKIDELRVSSKSGLILEEKKWEELRNALQKQSFRRVFIQIFRDSCRSRPFYVGKADDLRSRLSRHLSGGSKILRMIDEKMDQYDVEIGYYQLGDENETEGESILLETILTRIVSPSWVERIG